MGPYVLEEVVGSGTMGAVYKARHQRLGQPRAIKVLPPKWAMDTQFFERFQREATILEALSHPNIVHVYDVGEQNGLHYIVQEFVEGRSLRNLVQTEGGLAVDRALLILAQLAGALDYAHSQNVIHRDLKTANVIIGPDDHVTLVDFGLALAPEATQGPRLTLQSMVLGTPEYMAPEVATGGPATPASDLYALGIVTFEILTGRVPFQAPTSVQVLFAQAHTTPPAPSSLRAELPFAIDVGVLKMLSKDAAQRYPSAGAFVESLGGRKVEAQSQAEAMPGEKGGLRRFARRENSSAFSLVLVIAGGALIFLCLLAILVVVILAQGGSG